MPFQKRLAPLSISQEEKNVLDQIAHSRTEGFDRVRRARVLLAYSEGQSTTQIRDEVGISFGALSRCIKKALSCGVEEALVDLPRSGRPAEITQEARTWVVALACTKPKELGYAAELWTYNALAKHIRAHGPAAGFATLARISKGTVYKILQAHELKPHKINYYLERRDPEFERKMAEVLMVYREVEMQHQGDELDSPEVTISCDEKPGIQAIANIAPDLPPVPGHHRSVSRDYEYKRHGTVSLLAGLDLNSGHVFGIARNRHRSREFIELLQEIHAFYPKEWKIRLILDNHSSHISKETRAWLAKHPNRFVLVFTPKHGSWLNIVETLFSKMTRSFLRGLRVGSKQELISRIEQWLGEINAEPVIPRWSYQPEGNA